MHVITVAQSEWFALCRSTSHFSDNSERMFFIKLTPTCWFVIPVSLDFQEISPKLACQRSIWR